MAGNQDYTVPKVVDYRVAALHRALHSVMHNYLRAAWFLSNLGIFNQKLFLLTCQKHVKPNQKNDFLSFSPKTMIFGEIWDQKCILWLISVLKMYTSIYVNIKISTTVDKFQTFRVDTPLNMLKFRLANSHFWLGKWCYNEN